jgi:hypothetical protein
MTWRFAGKMIRRRICRIEGNVFVGEAKYHRGQHNMEKCLRRWRRGWWGRNLGIIGKDERRVSNRGRD